MGVFRVFDDSAARFLRFFVLFLVFCHALSGSASEDALQTVSLQLRWKHQFQFAGYYAAVEKGFYREAGLDVQLIEGDPGKTPVDEVLSKRAIYGVGSSELLFARLRGNPLVALAVIFQHSPSVLLARADSGIHTPRDLLGKRVMLMRGNRDTDFYALFRHEGVPLERVTILQSDYKIENLISGRVDAFNAYLTDDPFILKQRGVDFVEINPRHYGADSYGDTLFTTEQEIKGHPERVKAMREASLRGWRYAMEHPDEIIDLLLRKYRVQKSREHLAFEASRMYSLILPDLVEIGHMNPDRWQGMVDTLISAGMLDNDDVSLDGFIYDPDPRVMEKRLRYTVAYLAGVIALILIAFLLMFKTQKRLRREIRLRRQIEEQLLNANALLQRTGRLAKVGGFERNVARGTTVFGEEAARIWEVIPGKELSFEETVAYYPPDEHALRVTENERAIRHGVPWEHESLLSMPSGRRVWVYVRGEAISRGGQVIKLVGAAQDITDRKLAELALVRRTRELEMHNSILRHVHQGMPLAEVLNSLASQAELLHPGMLCSILLADAGGIRLRHVAAPSLPGQFVRAIDGLLENDKNCASCQAAVSGKRVLAENLDTNSDCSALYSAQMVKAGFLSCWAQPIKGREQRLLGVFTIYQRTPASPGDEDIQLLENCANLAALVIEHCQAEEKIRNLAFFDALTQLPNRRMLTDRLRQAMANSRRSGCYGALMFLDLDNFKPLNDTYGHYAGDLLLVQVAERIKSCVRETDTVARFGGDEFVVMLGELAESREESEDEARGVAEKIRYFLAEPFVVMLEKDGGSNLTVQHCCSASIGITLFFDHDVALENILKCADETMYRAKEAGRNNIQFFSLTGAPPPRETPRDSSDGAPGQ